jgi:hypothetical protein
MTIVTIRRNSRMNYVHKISGSIIAIRQVPVVREKISLPFVGPPSPLPAQDSAAELCRAIRPFPIIQSCIPWLDLPSFR